VEVYPKNNKKEEKSIFYHTSVLNGQGIIIERTGQIFAKNTTLIKFLNIFLKKVSLVEE
jgi:hypothetical protein